VIRVNGDLQTKLAKMKGEGDRFDIQEVKLKILKELASNRDIQIIGKSDDKFFILERDQY
jgi:hypothetical protein